MTNQLEVASYIFAKTMPKNPHEYTLRKNWDNKEFDKAVRFIRVNGIVEYFFGRPYVCFYNNGYKYWTMGAKVNETILINRCVVK